MSTSDAKLFSSIKYFTTGFRDPSLETTFKQNGATRLFYLTETTTHVICDDFDSNKSELEQAIEIYQTPIVNSDWINACLKCNSLLPIDPFRIAEHLFHSCSFANANLLNEDHSKIYALVTYYGGRWASHLDDSTCTHIICASALPSNDESSTNLDERLQTAYDLQTDKVHLITPDWILESINVNRLLDEHDFHPDLLRDPNEPMDVDEEELDDEQSTTNPNNQSVDENTPTKTTSHRSQLLSKNFFNQSDQTTPPPSAEPALGMTDGSNLPDSADASQTKPSAPKRPRARATPSTPRQRNTKVNSTTNPTLHTNLNGHSSTSKDATPSTLPIEEKLIRPSISTAKPTSQLTRHPPLESLSYELKYPLQDKHELVPSSQCLLGCVLYIHEQEYLSLVSPTELSSWSKTILDHGAQLTDDITHPDLTHFVCAYRTSDLFRQVCKRGHIRIVTAHWLNDVLQRKKLFVPNLAVHYPSPFDPKQSNQLPLDKYYLTITGFEGIERARLRYMIRSLGGKYSSHLTKWHTHLIARESGKSNKFKKASQWSMAIVNGLWLSELFLGNTWALKLPLDERYKRLTGTPVVDHFSFDQIFVHELLTAWAQPIRITDELLNAAIRRHNEQVHQHSQEIDHDQPTKPAFHYHQSCHSIPLDSNATISIMLSGFNRKTLTHYETLIKSLGGQLSSSPHETSHLILNRFLRTEKLYECMNYAKYILNKTWLDKSEEQKAFLPIEQSDWIGNEEDPTDESFFQQSIEKRVQRKNQFLFDGYTFFLTPSVQPSELIIRSIIYSAGGQISRDYSSIKLLIVKSEENHPRNYLILSCDKDRIFLEDLQKFNQRIPVLSVDFLLQSLLQQQILTTDSFVLQI